MSSESILDMQAIDALKELSPDAGSEFLRELIEIFLQDTPERIAELEAALAKGDIPAFTRAAHTVKGSSSNFGAVRLTRVAHELEMQGKSGQVVDSPATCQRLRTEYGLVAEALALLLRPA